MGQPGAVEADIQIGGSVSGQMIAGNYNVQIQNSNGCVVNVAPPSDRAQYSMRSLPINLRPRAFPSLLDRDGESTVLKTAVEAFSPVSIYGEEGIGKTTFVRQLIHLLNIANFPAGIVYLNASGRGLNDLSQLMFDTFYESLPEFKPRDAEIRHTLQNLKALVFLDNLNLPRDEIVSLLDTAPNCTFVLSSVERSLWGEGQVIVLRGLPEEDALTLFTREVGRPLNEEEQATARKICSLLQGHPLHILQAVSLVSNGLSSVNEILEEVQHDAPAKTVLAVALRQLTEYQERDLAILAAGGESAIPVEHLVSLSEDQNARKTLSELVSLGLVQAHSPRYSLTGDLASSLAALWDLSSWEDTLLNYFLGWLEGQPAQALIEESTDVLIHTVKKAGEKEQWPQVIRLGRALERSLILWKRWQAWADVLNLILKAAKSLGDRKAEAWALHQLGSRAMCLGQSEKARDLLTEALNIRKTIKDKAGLKVTQHNLNVLLRAPIPPKGGKPSGRPWFISGSGMMIALLMSGIFTYIGLSLTVPREMLPFPVPPIYLFPSATPMPSYTPTSTKTFTPTPTHTLTLSPTKTPTRTPTRKPTITRTSTRTPSLTPSAPILILTTGAFCRTGPGTAYPDITGVPAGETVDIVGRNADSTWYYIVWKRFNVRCWISSITGEAYGDLQGVPFRAAPAAVTPIPSTPTPYTLTP